MAAGNGPQCPIDGRHGRLYSWADGTERAWFCPHDAHGGNGRFFNDKAAYGQQDLEVTEHDMNQIYVTAAEAVIAGKADVNAEAQRISRERKSSAASELTKLTTMVDTLKAKRDSETTDKAAAKSAPKAAKAKAAPKAKEPKAPREKLEYVAPERFAALRDSLGMSNKQCADANAEAGLGSTLSRITELTHSKGSTIRIWGKVEPAWRSYAKKHKIKPAAKAD